MLMNKKYIEILSKIENAGFVAFIIGGYVRDYLLGINSEDIDIATNATPKDLVKIFDNAQVLEEYGAVKLLVNNHVVDITTFRREISYEGIKPDKIEYITSLEEDLKRRDFTINTLAMDKEGNIIDLLGARVDIQNKLIKTVRNVDVELREDASRIIRALRFMSTLDMNLDSAIVDFIDNNKELIKEVNINKRKEELDKIFASNGAEKFIEYVKEHKLEMAFSFEVTSFKNTTSLLGAYAQLQLLEDYPFTKQEKVQIKEIKSLLIKGNIDKIDVYQKGLYICSIAAEILDIDSKVINEMYLSLEIHEIKDIDITAEEICNFLNIKPGKELGSILKAIENDIVLGKLDNKKEAILNKLKR